MASLVDCPSCGISNSASAMYCTTCNASMARTMGAKSFSVRPKQRFGSLRSIATLLRVLGVCCLVLGGLIGGVAWLPFMFTTDYTLVTFAAAAPALGIGLGLALFALFQFGAAALIDVLLAIEENTRSMPERFAGALADAIQESDRLRRERDNGALSIAP